MKLTRFNICGTLDSYFDELGKLCDISSEIPMYIDSSRKDLRDKIDGINKDKIEITAIEKCNYGIVLSEECKKIEDTNLFCDEWIESKKQIQSFNEITVIVISLYKDFTEKKVLGLIDFCKESNIELFFLIARDVSSLSWLIAKQFMKLNENNRRAIFTHRNMSEIKMEKKGWEVYDIGYLKKNNPKQILETNQWSEIIFHSHGNEDLIHLDEYTICGNNKDIQQDEGCCPACGVLNGECFKESEKLIDINGLRVEKLYLLSCHNIPFADCCLYSMKYNVVLNAVDGYVKKVVASIAVHSSDMPEINEIVDNQATESIVVRLHKKMDDIQPFPSIIYIGTPEKKEVKPEITSYEGLTMVSRELLSRVFLMVSSGMLNQEHQIYKLSKKIISDYHSMTRRGTLNESECKNVNFEQEIINRLNPLSKYMIRIMSDDLSDDLHLFSSYNTMRAEIEEESISFEKCDCGSKLYICDYKPILPVYFPLHAEYCHKCGEKLISMVGMPEIHFKCKNNDNKGDYSITYEATIVSKTRGEVFYALLLPNSISKFCTTKREINRIKAKPGKEEIIRGKIEFDKKVVVQGYWMKLLVVQNAGISIARSFFNLW